MGVGCWFDAVGWDGMGGVGEEGRGCVLYGLGSGAMG